MSTNKDVRKAKHAAYEKKQEAEGKNVVNWIFGLLILGAVLFMIYSMFI